MKTMIKSILVLMALGAAALVSSAQDADGPPHGDDPRGRRQPPPLIAALDANHDGAIDATEIANASAALKSLDKNNDGQLTREELMPPRFDGPAPRQAGTNSAAGPRGFGREGGRMRHPPIVTALDANQDGVIDSTELANASAELKTLDKNKDGQLTREELMPPRRHRPPQGEDGPEDGGPPLDHAPGE